ncbi:MAG: hypothetical protein PHX03_04795, partial [Bacilli bacterium]|nr:hypothetical protein [Bacilli bacterium]
MKKRKNLGFMLTETLIVSTFVTASLLYMFIQFRQVYQNYDRTFSYNTINSLYAVNQIKKYIIDVDITTIGNELIESNNQYLELTSCQSNLFAEEEYCKKLFEALDIKKVYFTFNDISTLPAAMKSSYNVDTKTLTFLDYIQYQKSESG